MCDTVPARNERLVQILSYADPSLRRSRFHCLRVIVPFMLGCIAGAWLIGLIVCCGMGAAPVGVTESPDSRVGAFIWWLIFVGIASPVLFALVLGELTLFALAGFTCRRWWVAGLVGMACPCLPIALGIHTLPGVAIWERVRVDDGALVLVPLLVLLAPLLLVRRRSAVE